MNKEFYLGITKGATSAAAWGFYTVLSGILLSMAPFIGDKQVLFLAPFVSVFIYDSFSAIWIIAFLAVKSNLKDFFKVIKTRSSKFVILGALMGGPIGMTAYYMSIKFLGAPTTAAISSVYPAVGALLASIILKEKITKKAWTGLAIMIIAIILLGFTGGKASFNLLGVIFVIINVLGWGSECVICGYGMKNEEISPEHALLLRQITSSLVYGIIIIPIISGVGLVLKTLSNPQSIGMLIVMALSGAISYFCYYAAIHQIGATKAMVLNIGYSVWSMIFSWAMLGTNISIKMVVCTLLIIVGSIMVSMPKKEKFNP